MSFGLYMGVGNTSTTFKNNITGNMIVIKSMY